MLLELHQPIAGPYLLSRGRSYSSLILNKLDGTLQ